MSQISPPIRILLVCAIGFLGAYMLFLRPKTEAVPPADPAPNVQTNAPAESEPGKVAEAAQGAVAAADGQLKSQESVDGVDAGEAAAGTTSSTKSAGSAPSAAAAAPAADVAGLPKPVAKAIRKNQVLVLLFWNGKSADDKAVHAALRKVDRWDGRVSVQSASIKKIATYGRIARGVDVEQSPTVVVADPRLRADTLVGYVDTQTIDQTVVDALRNSGGLFTDSFLRAVNRTCAHYDNALWALPSAADGSQLAQVLDRGRVKWGKFQHDFAAIKAPKKWRAFKTAGAADLAAWAALYADWAAYLGSKPSSARIAASAERFGGRADAIEKRWNRRTDGEHLIACGSDSSF